MKLRETFLKRNISVAGDAVSFHIDTVRLPNGKKAKREYLDHPGAVAVIALAKKNQIVFVKQYRHAVGEITWEIPAGKLYRGENPLQCVKRELEEETGYTAKRFKKLISFWPTAAFANEIIHVYIAHGLKSGKPNPDQDEFLECALWPLSKAIKAIRSGKIKDGKTLIGLLAFLTFESGTRNKRGT